MLERVKSDCFPTIKRIKKQSVNKSALFGGLGGFGKTEAHFIKGKGVLEMGFRTFGNFRDI
jgi:hypothetical protein